MDVSSQRPLVKGSIWHMPTNQPTQRNLFQIALAAEPIQRRAERR